MGEDCASCARVVHRESGAEDGAPAHHTRKQTQAESEWRSRRSSSHVTPLQPSKPQSVAPAVPALTFLPDLDLRAAAAVLFRSSCVFFCCSRCSNHAVLRHPLLLIDTRLLLFLL